MSSSTPLRCVALAAGIVFLVPATTFASPSLDVDGRYVEADTEPPFSFPADSETPGSPFAPFVGSANQGGSEPCPQEPSNASAFATQDSTVAPTSFAGTGSASYSLMPGDCDPANAVASSVYEIEFTTFQSYHFDLEATLDRANVLLENDDGTVFVSLNDFTGNVSETLTLPANQYRIVVEVDFLEHAPPSGPDESGSGSYDFTLDLVPGPPPETVYDNTVNESPSSQFNPGTFEHGDEITLGGTERTVVEFHFIYELAVGGAGQTARVRFYDNDGPGGEPGTVLYDSGDFPIPATGGGAAPFVLEGLSVPVPDTFTWTVAWDGMGESIYNRLYTPPVVGSSDDDFYWLRPAGGGSWTSASLATPDRSNFYAYVEALPEASRAWLFGAGALALLALSRRRTRG